MTILWIDDAPVPVVSNNRRTFTCGPVDLSVSADSDHSYKYIICSYCELSKQPIASLEKTWPTEAVALLRKLADDLEAAINETEDKEAA